ncbi:MAG TPA: hypothetical protein VFT66_15660 [Roseiflexaceae bacterium]|nr:hypothetical protein [Roseiflexaceae bacterium]
MSDMYIPEQDITEERGGVTIQIAAKGVPIPMAEAKVRGFVKDPQPQGPQEVKAAAAAADAPAEQPVEAHPAKASKK